MTDGIEQVSRGENDIGPWVSLRCRILASSKSYLKPGSYNNVDPKAIASPEQVRKAQQALTEEADQRLGAYFLSGFALVVMADVYPPMLQMNVRYQGFNGETASLRMSAANLVRAASVEIGTRQINLEE